MAGMCPAHPAHRLGMSHRAYCIRLAGVTARRRAHGRDELTLASNARSAKRATLPPHAAAALRWACTSKRSTAATIALVDCVPNSTLVSASVSSPGTVLAAPPPANAITVVAAAWASTRSPRVRPAALPRSRVCCRREAGAATFWQRLPDCDAWIARPAIVHGGDHACSYLQRFRSLSWANPCAGAPLPRRSACSAR
jgi:hypothetical protein